MLMERSTAKLAVSNAYGASTPVEARLQTPTNPVCKPGGRLVDKVVACGPFLIATDATGKRHRLPNVGAQAAEIRAAATRFVLEADVSGWCAETVREDTGLLDPENPFLRMPMDCFWIEWLEPVEDRPFRVGTFVTCSPDGRKGELTGYVESRVGRPDRAIMTVHFDLDEPLADTADSVRSFSFRNADLSHLDALFDHAVAVIDPLWAQYVIEQYGAQYRQKVAEVIDWMWAHLPRILTFSILLQSHLPTRQTPVDLHRLNRRRGRSGRAALLDHIEVRLDLDYYRTDGNSGTATGSRAFPRLHPVRGHLVTRHGKTFWRAAHLRGDERRAILSRTTTVAGLPARRSGRATSSPG